MKTRTHLPLIRELNATGGEFLKLDLEIGFTFANVALRAVNNSEKRQRNREMSRKAYDTVSKMARRLDLSGAVRGEVNEKLARLRSQLEQLGERFE